MSKIITFGSKLSNGLRNKTQFYGSFNKKIKQQILEMQLIASQNNLGYLTTNQIGYDQSIFVLYNGSRLPSDYLVYYNPKITAISTDTITHYEESISFPIFKAKVTRHKLIKIQFSNNNGKDFEQEIKGNLALYYQQANDQIMGLNLLSWAVSHGQVEIKEKYQKDLSKCKKFMEVIYSHFLLRIFEKYVELGKQHNQQRNLSQLSMDEDCQTYYDHGPAYEIDYQEEQDQLLDELETELFYAL